MEIAEFISNLLINYGFILIPFISAMVALILGSFAAGATGIALAFFHAYFWFKLVEVGVPSWLKWLYSILGLANVQMLVAALIFLTDIALSAISTLIIEMYTKGKPLIEQE